MHAPIAIIGAGPAGTAAALAAALLDQPCLLIDRATFPRHKVCGDCLNPSAWPVLEELGAAAAIRALPHQPIRSVRFEDHRARGTTIALPPSPSGEIAVRRELLDQALLDLAIATGLVTSVLGQALTALSHHQGLWHIKAGHQSHTARFLLAADGRNSTAARLLGLSPPAARDRVAVQAHVSAALPAQQVALAITPHGYCGVAPVDAGLTNLCLVSTAPQLEAIKSWAASRFGLTPAPRWHALAPLARAPIDPAPLPCALLAGDAARVVEPLTGEGIYYALATGQLAGQALARLAAGEAWPAAASSYRLQHRRIYRGRLFTNQLARLAVTRPALGLSLVHLSRPFPHLLTILTKKVAAHPHPRRPLA
jgi:menaquinone-9 beta-reductase